MSTGSSAASRCSRSGPHRDRCRWLADRWPRPSRCGSEHARRDFDFDLPRGTDRAAAGASARCGAAAGRAGQPGPASSRTAALRDLPSLLAAGRHAGVQRHQGDPGAARPAGASAAASGRDRGDCCIARLDRIALARLRPARPSGSRSATASASARRAASACSASSMRRSSSKGEGGEVTLAFDFTGPVLDEAIAALGAHAAAALYRRRARPDDAATATDYQTVYARDEGAVAAPTAGLHFTPATAARAATRAASPRHSCHAACRRRHVPAGQGRGHRDHRMHAEWGEIDAETAARAQPARARGRAHRRGRHHGAAAARERAPMRTAASRLSRRDRHLHHARLSLPGRRAADDQFPPAALDAVHAGRRLCGPRHA